MLVGQVNFLHGISQALNNYFQQTWQVRILHLQYQDEKYWPYLLYINSKVIWL